METDLHQVGSESMLFPHPAPPFQFLTPRPVRASSLQIPLPQYAAAPIPLQSHQTQRPLACATLPPTAAQVAFVWSHKPTRYRADGASPIPDHDWLSCVSPLSPAQSAPLFRSSALGAMMPAPIGPAAAGFRAVRCLRRRSLGYQSLSSEELS